MGCHYFFLFLGMAEHNLLGKKAEEKAAVYLEMNGYEVLERNWRLKHKELDIICRKESLLVVVEVKARLAGEERPEELLSLRKRKNLMAAADAYIRRTGLKVEVRFDLLLLTGSDLEIEHIVDAFTVFD